MACLMWAYDTVIDQYTTISSAQNTDHLWTGMLDRLGKPPLFTGGETRDEVEAKARELIEHDVEGER